MHKAFICVQMYEGGTKKVLILFGFFTFVSKILLWFEISNIIQVWPLTMIDVWWCHWRHCNVFSRNFYK